MNPLNKISLKWTMIQEASLSVREKFALVRDLGYDGVELDAPTDLPLDELLAAREATGLSIPGLVNALHWRCPLTDPDPAVRQACAASVVTALEQARRLGATTVLLVPGVVDARTSYRAAYDRAVEEVGALLPHARRTGVSLAFENVWNDFLLSPLEAAGFVDEFLDGDGDGVGDPRAGWYLDVGNLLRYGHPVHWIEALGPRILKVDVKEFSLARMNAEGPWKGFDVELGEGDCDWHAVNRALAGVGYSGWASVEVPGGDRTRLAAIKARVDRIVAA